LSTTTYEDVEQHFVRRSAGAAETPEPLEQEPHKRDVVSFVHGAVTRTLYQETPARLLEVSTATEHALDDVRRCDVEGVRSIVDWHPSCAFEHVQRHADETLKTVPTYQNFRRFCAADAAASGMLLLPARDAVADGAARCTQHPRPRRHALANRRAER
jgi:hypothetical protein